MSSKRTMTINLSPAEMEVLEELCLKKDLSKTAVVKQALRIYQVIDSKLENGEKLYFEDFEKKEKSEFLVI